jgi:hypothetical protein
MLVWIALFKIDCFKQFAQTQPLIESTVSRINKMIGGHPLLLLGSLYSLGHRSINATVQGHYEINLRVPSWQTVILEENPI